MHDQQVLWLLITTVIPLLHNKPAGWRGVFYIEYSSEIH